MIISRRSRPSCPPAIAFCSLRRSAPTAARWYPPPLSCRPAKTPARWAPQRGARKPALSSSELHALRSGAQGKPGLLTGYYEPVLEGSRKQHGAIRCPSTSCPPELITLVDETKAQSWHHDPWPQDGQRFEPFYNACADRAGRARGRNLELVYLAIRSMRSSCRSRIGARAAG